MNSSALPPRRSLQSSPSVLRTLLARSFALVALAATFFGLAMLIVFFVSIGRGVVGYFRETPALVREENERLAARVELARDAEAFTARELASLRAERENDLRRARSDEERTRILKDYERIEARERRQVEEKRQQELARENDIRPDVSAPALLGHFVRSGPSPQPEDAGIQPALVGSILLGLITILVAVPLGVGAAIYLEEYRQASWLARIIQVNINNLAGVPSIMFGILGTFVFVDLIFGPLEKGYPNLHIKARNVLGGGLTLALLTLPVIIVSAQEAIRAVPVSLRHASIALGATRWQTVWRVVLPSSLPGIMTGTILALSRALGEAAPLVFFGALLYVDESPGLLSRFTVLPMQIFNWSQRPGAEWKHAAALASAVLLLTLLALNGTAIYLRQRAQRHTKW